MHYIGASFSLAGVNPSLPLARCLKTEGLADKGFALASTSGTEMPGSPPGPARTPLDGRSIDPAGDGVRNIYIVSNPKKLERLHLLQTLTC